MRTDKLISFIIPAYNASTTLKKCILSIVDNNASDIEILIIENASSDLTTEIAHSMSSMDSRIKILHSDKGVSNARNMGIKEAKGKWIVFVDADDFIIEGKINRIIEDARISDADLVLYGHYVGKKCRKVNNENSEKVYINKDIEDIRVEMLKNPTKYMQVWAKLFRNEVIKSNGIFFDNRLRLSEDSDFTLRYSKYCKKIVLSSECIYQYVLNPDSTMRVVDGEKVKDYEFAMNVTFQSVTKESYNIKNAFLKYVLMHLNILMVREVFNVQNVNGYLIKYKQMRQILDSSIFKEAINSTQFSECISLRMLPVLFFKLKMFPVASILFVVRAGLNYKEEQNTVLSNH